MGDAAPKMTTSPVVIRGGGGGLYLNPEEVEGPPVLHVEFSGLGHVSYFLHRRAIYPAEGFGSRGYHLAYTLSPHLDPCYVCGSHGFRSL